MKEEAVLIFVMDSQQRVASISKVTGAPEVMLQVKFTIQPPGGKTEASPWLTLPLDGAERLVAQLQRSIAAAREASGSPPMSSRPTRPH
jgi:hypothetical protein